MTYREMVERVAKSMYDYVHEVSPKSYPENWEWIIKNEPGYYDTAMNAGEHALGTVLAILEEMLDNDDELLS